jgi:hypothetical protein
MKSMTPSAPCGCSLGSTTEFGLAAAGSLEIASPYRPLSERRGNPPPEIQRHCKIL